MYFCSVQPLLLGFLFIRQGNALETLWDVCVYVLFLQLQSLTFSVEEIKMHGYGSTEEDESTLHGFMER